MLMLNLFCIHFALKETFYSVITELFFAQLIQAQSTHLIPFICCWKHLYLFFFLPLVHHSRSSLFIKVAIIFQAAVGRMLGRACVGEQRRVSPSAKSVHKSPRQGLSTFHYPPSTFTGLSAWPIYLIISLENCSVLLFCCPPACEYMACVYLRFSGGSVHLRGIELVTADFKKINRSQV